MARAARVCFAATQQRDGWLRANRAPMRAKEATLSLAALDDCTIEALSKITPIDDLEE